MLSEGVPYFRSGAISIVGHAVHYDRCAAGTVTFVAQLIITIGVITTRTTLDRSVGGIFRYVRTICLIYGQAQTGITIQIAPTRFRSYSDFTQQLGPDFPSFLIVGRFFMFNIGPFTVSSHCHPLKFELDGSLPLLRPRGHVLQ